MIRTIIPAALVALMPAAAITGAHAETHAEASDPTDAVDAFMQAFDAQDAEAMRALVVDDVSVSVIEERDGPDRVSAVPLSRLIDTIASSTSDLAEPIGHLQYYERGPVATVLTDYEFLIDGERSHCGTNMFNLLRVDGHWKIAGIAYSHVEGGCDAGLEE
ncbi:MAG: nuclear transport factor 2 family protein [Pseudomonadota bacterium]